MFIATEYGITWSSGQFLCHNICNPSEN